MSHGDSQRIARRISEAIALADATQDEELRSHLSRYLCVLASGYIEAECCRILLAFAKPRGSAELYRFVSAQLHFFQNPTIEKILVITGQFDESKRAALEAKIDQAHKDSVNSIVGNKNNIAHGVDTGISLARFKGYFDNTLLFLGELQKLFAAKSS